MDQKKPKRIAVIGLPGSGKSTFAVKLGKTLNLPVHHLDKHLFDGKHRRPQEDFLTAKEAILKEDSWIIEGCSIKTLEMRFLRADTIIYFDLPRLLCIWRVCKRPFSLDQDLAKSGCLNGINWDLFKYIWNFNRDKRQSIEELCRKYPQVNFIPFFSPQEADEYLERMNTSIQLN